LFLEIKIFRKEKGVGGGVIFLIYRLQHVEYEKGGERQSSIVMKSAY
jgi:hypothetical protein